jgi:predicted nucleic acid-binding protein
MVERLSFDTTFFIDLQKERRRDGSRLAHTFLAEHSAAGMFISAIALGEFAEGFSSLTDPNLLRLISALEVLQVDQEVSLIYAANARFLREKGMLIGSNDLWIGSCAVRNRMPLVTRNAKHFKRILEIEVIEY